MNRPLPRRTFWLIELCLGDDRLGLVLHVFEEGDFDWSPDKTRALRFVTRHQAESFGRQQEIHDFLAAEYEPDEIVSLAAELTICSIDV
jgi:hypothetical protein